MSNILVALMLLLVPICSFQLQVSSIECVSRDSVEVHFIANQSNVALDNSQVDFVMNGVSYVAPFSKSTGSSYHFSTVISVTGAFTETITEAYIQYGETRIDAHNLPYTKTGNCNPTAVVLMRLAGGTAQGYELEVFLMVLVAAIVVLVLCRKRTPH